LTQQLQGSLQLVTMPCYRVSNTRAIKEGSSRKRKIMTIEKVIGRTLAGQPKKTPETTFGVAQVFTLVLLVGFVALNVAVLLLMIAIV
jgi:hypothetical protein